MWNSGSNPDAVTSLNNMSFVKVGRSSGPYTIDGEEPQVVRYNFVGEEEQELDYVDEKEGKIAYLPHSCDEWIIGNKAAVVELIAELQAILPQL